MAQKLQSAIKGQDKQVASDNFHKREPMNG